MLRGLPGSGKSTFAKKLVAGDIHAMGRNWTRVNNDEFRETLHNGKWSKHNEELITKTRDFLIEQALLSGDNVVVDNLNLHPKHAIKLQEIAKKHGAQFEEKFFDVDVEECIKRDLKRPNSVGEKVIMGWYNDFLKPRPEVYKPPEDKPLALIVDADGTLAHIVTDRDVYDGSRAGEDACDPVVGEMVKHYSRLGYTIIICSGRTDDTRDVTEQWLKNNSIHYDKLFMRKAGDRRKDSIIKHEIFNEYIRDNYEISFVLDDRDQVVKMWRDDIGLKVLQVASGDF